MSDPRRSTQSTPVSERFHGSPSPSRRPVRVLLWLLIVVGAGANTVTSIGPFHPAISVVLGVATVVCIALLIAHHLRERR